MQVAVLGPGAKEHDIRQSDLRKEDMEASTCLIWFHIVNGESPGMFGRA